MSFITKEVRKVVLCSYNLGTVGVEWAGDLENTCIMVKFMCQLDWATECPDIGYTLYLGMSVSLFPDNIKHLHL